VSERRFGVSALELGLALRKARNELEFLARGGDKIGDHRHIDPSRRDFGLERIEWFRRPGIDGRLCEHVVGYGQWFAAGAFGIAQLAPFRNQLPVRARGRSVALPRLVVFLERTAVLRHCGGEIRLLQQSIGRLAALRRGWR